VTPGRTTTESEQLLVLAPTGRDSAMAVSLLKRHGFDATACCNAEELYASLESDIGGIIVAEEALTAAFVKRMLEFFEEQLPWSDLPTIILSTKDTSDAVNPLYRRSNVTVLERPVKTRMLVSVLQNVLAARRRQYQVRSLLAELQESIHERDQFLAMLSHELRNPLSAISSSLESITWKFGESSEKAIGIAKRQIRLITRLLDDLLDISRFANAKIRLDKTLVRISEPLNAAADACRANFLQRQQEFSVKLGKDALLSGDPSRLNQLFSNLLINASKYTPHGGRIELSCEVKGGNAEVRVRDTGIGIAPELLSQVFEPFVQGEQEIDRSQGGLGLGLTLARNIASLHGGFIEASSPGAGRGSEFLVRLPIASAETQGAGAEPLVRDAADSPSLRILLAEDDTDVAESLKSVLQLFGHEVYAARDGFTALQSASLIQPQVVLLDIGLPGINGYTLAKQLRDRPYRGRLLLIAISGYGQPDDIQRSKQAGIDHHLVKPIEIGKLQGILAQYHSTSSISS
jgi:signal transduction histidine kinase/CheY-like chemotaxis protein